MKKNTIIVIICVAMLVIGSESFAQTVTNVISTQVNKTIQVSYDLDKQANITLHLSTDGGKTYQQLNQVSGDVGENVSAGHKTIVWDVLAEQELLVGDDIVFKVKAGAGMSFTVNGVAFTMIYVKGGTFIMGCTSERARDCNDNEKPAHSVTLSDYWIGETEVTQALWKAIMGINPSYFKGDSLPVEKVSWYDCQKFIQKLNSLTGKNFRLPTEAEWEYAARGGEKSKGYKYSGGDNLVDVAWYWQNSGDKFLKGTFNDNLTWKKVSYNNGTTHPVKSKIANELGLYDMSGNVWEWCSDWYGSYSNSSQTNPTGPSSGSYRVSRGGGWDDSAKSCQVAYRRYYYGPQYRYDGLGFRLALVQE